MEDALSDDLFLLSYSYNIREPRYFTKNFAMNKTMSQDYDVEMVFATQATSATPYYFDPLIHHVKKDKNKGDSGFEEEILIDGTVSGNDPSMHAVIYAKNWRQKDNIRLVSLGFNPLSDETTKFEEWNGLDWLARYEEFIIDVRSSSHAFLAE